MNRGSAKGFQAFGWTWRAAALTLACCASGLNFVISWSRPDASSLLTPGIVFAVLGCAAILAAFRARSLKEEGDQALPLPPAPSRERPREGVAIRLTGLKNPDSVEHWFDACMVRQAVKIGVQSAGLCVLTNRRCGIASSLAIMSSTGTIRASSQGLRSKAGAGASPQVAWGRRPGRAP